MFLPPKFVLISCRPIDSYSDIFYLGTDELMIFVSFIAMNDLSRSSIFDIYIYLSILTNTKIIEKLDALIEEWLIKVDAISVSGTIKSWIVDKLNVVVSRFSWPLLVYDFSQSVVQNWSNRCVAFYKNGSK